MFDSEKRSIRRHSLEEPVRFNGGGGSLRGETVDISRNGMRVRLKGDPGIPDSSLVSVMLPGVGSDGIPCLVKRSRKSEKHWEIGLEFHGENEARMLLVERWLESLENRKITGESAPIDSRSVPRTKCTLRDIRAIDGDIEILSADDISMEGMLLRIKGAAGKGDVLSLTMQLSASDREIPFEARVAYAVPEESGETSLGISIIDMKETDRNRLRSFIVEIATGAAMLEYRRLLERDEPTLEYRVEGADAAELIGSLEGTTVNVLDESGLRILETLVEESGNGSFRAAVPNPGEGASFFSFMKEGSSYFFSSAMREWSDGIGVFEVPGTVFRGEKRAGSRKAPGGGSTAILATPGGTAKAAVLDASRRGILCEIPIEDYPGPPPAAGDSLIVRTGGKETPSEIRHVLERDREGGRRVYRMGLETGLSRSLPASRIYGEGELTETWNGPPRPLARKELVRPRIVRYDDPEGRTIVALLHILDESSPCTAVVIPPAFGKKKEALAPLALTLMAHFASAGENIAVLRYDGIDKPGESDNANSRARRGYEMLGYRIDRGYADLEATMKWVGSNDIFEAEKTVLVSFSMAALDARRLQSDPSAPRADYWISVMGVSSSQGALRNILGGLDVIANHRMGLPIGTMGMLGQLIDMDRMASDMIRLGYATAADAREAMSKIESPVTWIYGTHDKWMIPEEIRDVMSVAAPGDRELIELPTAHNLRTSDDAIATFQLISDSILRKLHGRTAAPVSPDKSELLDLLTRERERAAEAESLNAKNYWKGYLVGETEGTEGYDFYRRLVDFRDFIQVEAEMLDPRPGESIADMGCGTGLVSEVILARLSASGRNLKGTRFTAVDLVDEALEKAREKYLFLSKSHGNLADVDDDWRTLDLEPDPLARIRRCASVPGPVTAEFLRDGVKGLKSEAVDRLASLPESLVSPLLKGAASFRSSEKDLEGLLSPADAMLLSDLNRAARFASGSLKEEDLKPGFRSGSGIIPPERLDEIRTSHLHWSVLDFGDWGRDGRLPVPDESFDGICASLFLSYLFAPGEVVKEFHRMLKPGGRLLLSTMKPDSDISGIFTAYIAEQAALDARSAKDEEREKNLREARSMLNEAASLFSLEEDGWFRFFDDDELLSMMEEAGFEGLRTRESLGNPPQAEIILGFKKNI